MDDDYFHIEARVREARRLRSEAAGELVAAGIEHVRRAIAAGMKSLYAFLRTHHPLHH